MSEWKEIKLGEIAKVISGYAFKSKDFTRDFGIPAIKIKNIKNGNIDLDDCDYVDNSFLKLNKRYHLINKDILVSLTGSHLTQPNSVVGRIARYRHKITSLLNQRAGKIIPDNNLVDSDYLYSFLSQDSIKESIALRARGAANQANISPGDVEDTIINLPPLPIQRRIASILSAYDDLIENNLKRIKLLEESMQIILAKLIKDANSSSDFIYPKIADFDKGFEPGSNNYEEENCDGLIPFFRVGDLSTRDSKLYISSDLKGIKLAQSEDILISMDGSIGIVSIGINGAYSSGIRKVEVKNQLYKGLIYSFLKSPIGQSQIMTYAKGSTILHASSCIPKLNMVLPSEHKFNRELELSNLGLQQIINLIALNKKLKESRDILLPKLMSGKINIA